MRKMVAIGGGEIGRPGYSIETTEIDKEIIALTGKARPNPTSAVSRTAVRRLSVELAHEALFFPLHFVNFHVRRQRQSEPLEQYRLMFRRLRHTPTTDVDATFCGQHNIHHLYLRNLVEDLSRLTSQTSRLAHLRERFPDNIRQETNQDVRLHPFLPLMPYRTDRQIALRDAKRSLRLS